MKVYEYLGFSDEQMNKAFLRVMDIMFSKGKKDYGSIAKNLFTYMKKHKDEDVLLVMILAMVSLYAKAGDTVKAINSLSKEDE